MDLQILKEKNKINLTDDEIRDKIKELVIENKEYEEEYKQIKDRLKEELENQARQLLTKTLNFKETDKNNYKFLSNDIHVNIKIDFIKNNIILKGNSSPKMVCFDLNMKRLEKLNWELSGEVYNNKDNYKYVELVNKGSRCLDFIQELYNTKESVEENNNIIQELKNVELKNIKIYEEEGETKTIEEFITEKIQNL